MKLKTSCEWLAYFKKNLQQKRINWQTEPTITLEEKLTVIKSLQAWQLGETSDGTNLINAANKYANKINDSYYVEAIRLFIKEEQKHGENLGKYLDNIHYPRIKKNWGDSLFRKIRGLNTSMEWWTLAVITVECAAQVYYQSLKDATNCNLLKQVCTDILIDEAPHIQFQQERMAIIFKNKPKLIRIVSYFFYKIFYFSTSMLVWFAHKKVFIAGNVHFKKYLHEMNNKYNKTLGRLIYNKAFITNQNKTALAIH
jgi:hypothetical protein